MQRILRVMAYTWLPNEVWTLRCVNFANSLFITNGRNIYLQCKVNVYIYVIVDKKGRITKKSDIHYCECPYSGSRRFHWLKYTYTRIILNGSFILFVFNNPLNICIFSWFKHIWDIYVFYFIMFYILLFV